MTKREFNKYHKEVYDKYNNRLYPGDTVVIPDGYFSDCHIGIVDHFANKTVVLYVPSVRHRGYYQQRSSDRIIKVKDKNGDYSFMQNWPEKMVK